MRTQGAPISSSPLRGAIPRTASDPKLCPNVASINPQSKKKSNATALSPHALHVHPLLPVGSTRIVWTRGSPIHSTESVAAAVSGTVEPIIAVPQVPQDVRATVTKEQSKKERSPARWIGPVDAVPWCPRFTDAAVQLRARGKLTNGRADQGQRF